MSKIKKVQPIIVVSQAQPDSWDLVALKDGEEKPNSGFNINNATYQKSYKHHTLTPDGTATTETAKFKVKKKYSKK